IWCGIHTGDVQHRENTQLGTYMCCESSGVCHCCVRPWTTACGYKNARVHAVASTPAQGRRGYQGHCDIRADSTIPPVTRQAIKRSPECSCVLAQACALLLRRANYRRQVLRTATNPAILPGDISA